MARLASSPAFLQRVKTFKEINMHFLATEASAFHLDMPRCLPALFSPRPDGAVVAEVVHKLVSLCVTLNEYPHVRYSQNSVLGARLATLVQDALNVRTCVVRAFYVTVCMRACVACAGRAQCMYVRALYVRCT